MTSHAQPSHATAQPAAKPGMSVNHRLEGLAKTAGHSYAKELGHDAADQTMDYEKANGEQQIDDAQKQLDDAKAQAQGLWAKYCACFSGA